MARTVILVVSASERDASHVVTQQIDVVGGDEVFTVGLSSDGAEPITHYWCCWRVTDKQWDYLQSKFGANSSGRWMFDASSDAVLEELGLKRIIYDRRR